MGFQMPRALSVTWSSKRTQSGFLDSVLRSPDLGHKAASLITTIARIQRGKNLPGQRVGMIIYEARERVKSRGLGFKS